MIISSNWMQRKKVTDVFRIDSLMPAASLVQLTAEVSTQKAFEFTRKDPTGAPEEGSEDCLYMVLGSQTLMRIDEIDHWTSSELKKIFMWKNLLWKLIKTYRFIFTFMVVPFSQVRVNLDQSYHLIRFKLWPVKRIQWWNWRCTYSVRAGNNCCGCEL